MLVVSHVSFALTEIAKLTILERRFEVVRPVNQFRIRYYLRYNYSTGRIRSVGIRRLVLEQRQLSTKLKHKEI